jgi:sugar transferase (PEP-CTERM system associated)
MLHFLRQQSTRWFLFLGCAELVLAFLGVFFAIHTRFADDPVGLDEAMSLLLPRGALFALAIVLGLSAMGLYQRYLRESLVGMTVRMAVGFVLGAVGLIVVYYLFPGSYVGRGVFALALGYGFAMTGALRLVFFQLIDEETLKRRVLVLGAGTRAATILQRLRRRTDRRSFHIVGFVPMRGEHTEVDERWLRRPDCDLADYCRRHRVDEIVVGPDDRRGTLPMSELLACRVAGVEVIELANFFERESGKIKLGLVHPSWLVFSTGFDANGLRLLVKRTFDVLASLVLLVVALPLMALTALAIWIESGFRGPIIYRQERVGEWGESFMLLKFRSMRTDAERDGRAQWAQANDDRVTRVGRVIRKIRFDELPQLLNVMRGEMSLIGPRPERPQFVRQLEERIPYYGLRHWVKPGLTGWAQLRFPYGASEADAEEKLKFDLFYVKNHGLAFDFVILVQTVEVVLFGRGAR